MASLFLLLASIQIHIIFAVTYYYDHIKAHAVNAYLYSGICILDHHHVHIWIYVR